MRKAFAIRPGLLLGAPLLLLAVAGCNSHPTNEQVQQQAAETTAAVKQGAQQTAADARVAAGKAEEKLNAIAAGVKQGLQGDAASRVDLNTASNAQLMTLPGMSAARARKIVAGRPYASTEEVVVRGVLTQAQFDPISSHVKVTGGAGK